MFPFNLVVLITLLVAPLKLGLFLHANLQRSTYLCRQLSFCAAIAPMHLLVVFSAYPRPRVAGVRISSSRGATKN